MELLRTVQCFLILKSTCYGSPEENRVLRRRCEYLQTEGCSCWSRFGTITISCNNLGLTQFPTLKTLPQDASLILDLTSNQIPSIPAGELSRVRLKKMIMKNNMNLTLDPLCFENSMSLTYVDLSNCSLSSFPDALQHVTNLRTLLLKDNQITLLPGEVASLINLHTLDISGEIGLEIDPEAFRGINNLESLSLTLSDKYVRENADQVLSCWHGNRLQSLTFRNTNLLIDQNPLIYLINGMCLPNLSEFTCEACGLSDNSLGFINNKTGPRLTKLRLQKNNLTSDSISRLVHVAYDSGIPSLLMNAKELDLSQNQITYINITDPRRYFPNLEIFNFSNNQIIEVSTDFFVLQKLSVFDLRYNQITGLNLENIGWKKGQLSVFLEGNPFKCDCENQWIEEILRYSHQASIAPLTAPDAHNLLCASPHPHTGSTFDEIYISSICCNLREMYQELIDEAIAEGKPTRRKWYEAVRRSCTQSN